MTLPDRPSAVFASNDQQAIGAMTAAHELVIRVPQELSLIGLDDVDAASATNPPLTTLRRPQRDYGAAAMQFLLERIENRGPALPRRRMYPCELIVRGSTAPPAGGARTTPGRTRRRTPASAMAWAARTSR